MQDREHVQVRSKPCVPAPPSHGLKSRRCTAGERTDRRVRKQTLKPGRRLHMGDVGGLHPHHHDDVIIMLLTMVSVIIISNINRTTAHCLMRPGESDTRIIVRRLPNGPCPGPDPGPGPGPSRRPLSKPKAEPLPPTDEYLGCYRQAASVKRPPGPPGPPGARPSAGVAGYRPRAQNLSSPP